MVKRTSTGKKRSANGVIPMGGSNLANEFQFVLGNFTNGDGGAHLNFWTLETRRPRRVL